MSQSRQVQCLACGNADNSKYSFIKEGVHHIVCHICNARTLVVEPSEHAVNYEGQFENGNHLLDMKEYGLAYKVFGELCTYHSSDPRSWYGFARAVSSDFTCYEEKALELIEQACKLAKDYEFSDSYERVREYLLKKTALNEAESKYKQNEVNIAQITNQLNMIDSKKESEESEFTYHRDALTNAKKEYYQAKRKLSGYHFAKTVLLVAGSLFVGTCIFLFLMAVNGDISFVNILYLRRYFEIEPKNTIVTIIFVSSLVFGPICISIGRDYARKSKDQIVNMVLESKETQFHSAQEAYSRAQLNRVHSKQNESTLIRRVGDLEREGEALSDEINRLRKEVENLRFTI